MSRRTQPHQSHPAVVVDTSILMALPDIHQFNWGVRPITVYVLDAVVDELRGLARDRQDDTRATAARRALFVLGNLQKGAPPEGVPLPNNTGRLIFAEAPTNIPSPLDPTSVDHQQIALAQVHLKTSPGRFCTIVTNDQEMADIAASASPAVPVTTPGGGAIDKAIRRQLATKMYWWKLFRRERAAADKPRPVKSARPAPMSRSDRQVRLERVRVACTVGCARRAIGLSWPSPHWRHAWLSLPTSSASWLGARIALYSFSWRTSPRPSTGQGNCADDAICGPTLYSSLASMACLEFAAPTSLFTATTRLSAASTNMPLDLGMLAGVLPLS